MKPSFTKITMMVAIALAALSMNAAAQDINRRTVKIAFAFTAGSTQLPAGEYTIEPLNRDSATRIFVVRSKTTKEQVILSVVPTQKKMMWDKAALSFNRYGEQSFISLINMGDTRYAVTRTKVEREAEKQFTAHTKANNQTSEVRD